jgi:hypothetical protein
VSQNAGITINITLMVRIIEWAFYVETALRGFDLAFHLTDDPPKHRTDDTNADAVKTWQLN